MSPTVVIVGSSVGGIRTAQALRANKFAGDVLVLGEDRDVPYDKPPLSKAWLTWQAELADLRLIPDRIEPPDIALRLGLRADRLDVAAHHVHLESGEVVPYDQVVIATGARARPSPWAASNGVHVLRTLADAHALRDDLHRGGPLVVIGAGFIGSEVASSARTLGLEVTVVDPLPVPMARVIGEGTGQLLSDLHRRHGTATCFGVGVEAVDGEQGALRVELTDGATLSAATVVVGIGALPNDQWLASSGLQIDSGVLCDEQCQAMGASDVFAVGDVARWYHPRHGRHVRVEHWTNATEQASCVAHNIAHPDEPRAYQPVEYVWSDQYDWKIQIAGRPEDGAGTVPIGDPATDHRFGVLYADDEDRLCGAVTVNWPRAIVECRRMLAAAGTLDAAADRLGALHA